VAARQFGAIARHQLHELGFSEARIRSWLAGERLHRRYPGVYSFGRHDLSERGQLAAGLLFAGRGAALGGLTALWWMGLLHRRPRRIHIDAPGRKASLQDLQVRHPSRVQRISHRQLPVVPLPQALLASAESLGLNSLRLVLARAEFEGLVSLSAVHAALGVGRAGSRSVRAALEVHLPQLARCTNPLEIDFVLLCERHGLQIPEPNPRVGRYRPDMLWRDALLIVELDGRAAHTTAAQLEADRSRQTALEALGWTVLRFTWAEVRYAAERVVAEVQSAMIGRCASPSQPTK
jgi:hypothetical protein